MISKWRWLVPAGLLVLAALSVAQSWEVVYPVTTTMIVERGTMYGVTSCRVDEAVFGDEMLGMEVTATFADGSSETRAWAAIDPAVRKGGVSGTGWSLTYEGYTFQVPYYYWVLEVDEDTQIVSLAFDGEPAETYFDLTPKFEIDGVPVGETGGSAAGLNFTVFYMTGPGDVVPEIGATATYRDRVAPCCLYPAGDLYLRVRVDFSGDPLRDCTMYFFLDTDKSLTPGELRSLNTEDTRPPTIDMPRNVYSLAANAQEMEFTAQVSDPDGDPLTCTWRFLGSDGVVYGPFDRPPTASGTTTFSLADIDDYLGPYYWAAELTVTDGHYVCRGFTYVTLAASIPVVTVDGAGVYPCSEDVRIVLTPSVAQYDGLELDYSLFREDYSGGYPPEVTYYLTGTVKPPFGGEPVRLDSVDIGSAADLGCGTHYLGFRTSGYYLPVAGTWVVITIVEDTTAPTLSATASTNILWPPNHKLVDVTLSVDASDDLDAELDLSVEVESSEPPEADGDGNFLPDFVIDEVDASAGTVRLRLRAERSARGDGRTYTVYVTATDDSGNATTIPVTVVAPHDFRKE